MYFSLLFEGVFLLRFFDYFKNSIITIHKLGANPSFLNDRGQSAFLLGAAYGKLPVVKELLRYRISYKIYFRRTLF